MSQATRPANTTKKGWPWVAGAAGGVILIAGAVNAGKAAGQAEVPPAAAAVVETSVSTSLMTATVVSSSVITSVVTSAVTQTVAAEPVTLTATVTVTAAAEAAVAATVQAPVAAVDAPAAPAPLPLAGVPSTSNEPAAEPAPQAASKYYKNCTAARAAGAAPVRVGDPGYGPHLDRDGDGVGCE